MNFFVTNIFRFRYPKSKNFSVSNPRPLILQRMLILKETAWLFLFRYALKIKIASENSTERSCFILWYLAVIAGPGQKKS